MKIQIEKPLLKSLAMMASMIEARDAYAGGHLWRVSPYPQQLAEAAGLPTGNGFFVQAGRLCAADSATHSKRDCRDQ